MQSTRQHIGYIKYSEETAVIVMKMNDDSGEDFRGAWLLGQDWPPGGFSAESSHGIVTKRSCSPNAFLSGT